MSDNVKKVSDLTDTILIKPDKIKAPDGLKEKLFRQVEKISKFSKEKQLKSLIIAYENFFCIILKI